VLNSGKVVSNAQSSRIGWNVRILWELAVVAMYAMGFAFIGGVIGLVVACMCEQMRVVKYSWYVDSFNAAFLSFLVGSVMGGLLGLCWSVRRWCKRKWPAAELEDELW
jgi:hypothetical protein